jgi:hypothetical protein
MSPRYGELFISNHVFPWNPFIFSRRQNLRKILDLMYENINTCFKSFWSLTTSCLFSLFFLAYTYSWKVNQMDTPNVMTSVTCTSPCWGMAQVAEYLPSNCEALNSNLTNAKNRNKNMSMPMLHSPYRVLHLFFFFYLILFAVWGLNPRHALYCWAIPCSPPTSVLSLDTHATLCNQRWELKSVQQSSLRGCLKP